MTSLLPEINEIVQSLRQFLMQRESNVTEYQLIQHLEHAGLFAELLDADASLALFQKHFLTMHALYRLQASLYEEGYRLLISPLSIQLTSFAPGDAGHGRALDDAPESLRSYYLDLDHFHSATSHSVTDLLETFWRRFNSQDQADQAFALIGVSAQASWRDVQKSYRQKAAHAHPDKGGDAARFIELRNAFQVLKNHYNR